MIVYYSDPDGIKGFGIFAEVRLHGGELKVPPSFPAPAPDRYLQRWHGDPETKEAAVITDDAGELSTQGRKRLDARKRWI